MSKSLAKLYYIEQLRTKPSSHRVISNRMKGKFDVSPSAVKDELLADGYIKLSKIVKSGETQKNNHYYVLTGKKYKHVEEPKKTKSVVIEKFWPCGTKKSFGNAFDLSQSKGLFSNRELANMTNKGNPNNFPITVYSRA